MKGLYQWISARASFFRSDTVGQGAATTRTVCTEVTVERESTTVVASAAAVFALCPLCGQKLAPAQAASERLRLNQGSTAEKRETVDSPISRVHK